MMSSDPTIDNARGVRAGEPEFAGEEPEGSGSALPTSPSGNVHVDALAGRIGARPAGSAQEQQAAEYVVGRLAERGLPAVGLPIVAPVLAGWPELASLL